MKTNRKMKLLYGTLFILLGVSVAINFVLYERLRYYYTLLYATKLDPLDLSSYNSVDQQVVAERKPIVVFFGDSRAAQWPEPLLAGYQMVNRGIGNQTSAQAVGRFDDHIRPLQPDIVVLQVGINDLKTIPLFPKRKQEIILNCKTNIQMIIQNSLELGSSVIITTIFPAGKVPLFRRLVWSDEIDRAVEEVNNYIRQLAQDHVIVFDAAKVLADTNGKVHQGYQLDELHLNEAGYEILNHDLIRILENLE